MVERCTHMPEELGSKPARETDFFVVLVCRFPCGGYFKALVTSSWSDFAHELT